MNRETRVMKEYTAFPKSPSLLDPHHQIVKCYIYIYIYIYILRKSNIFVEMHSVYSAAPAEWARLIRNFGLICILCLMF